MGYSALDHRQRPLVITPRLAVGTLGLEQDTHVMQARAEVGVTVRILTLRIKLFADLERLFDLLQGRRGLPALIELGSSIG